MASASSRRDFLVAMLGAAAASCRLHREVPGELRGPSVDVGHRLRSLPELGPPAREERVPVVIVGGGPSGLAAAWRLERIGEPRYVLLELEPKLGGTSAYDSDGVVPYPWGAHYVPIPRRDQVAFVRLLRELGAITGEDDRGALIPAEEMVVRDPEERCFYDGAWHEGLFPSDGASAEELAEHARFLAEMDRFAAMVDEKGRRAFEIPIERGATSGPTELDRMSMKEWMLARGYRGARLFWLVDYACRDDYGLVAEETSAWAGVFYFASRIDRPGEGAAELLAWTNGNGRLVDQLALASRGKTRVRHLVVDVATFDDRAEVTAIDLARSDTVRFVAERVIFAAPKFVAARVLRPFRDHPPSWLAELSYAPWTVANVHMTAHPRSRGAPIAWDNVVKDSPSLGYVVATHQAMVDDGPTVLTYYHAHAGERPSEARKKLLAADHRALADMVMADLGPAHLRFDRDVRRIDVYRWAHGMAQPRVGTMWSGLREKASAPVGRVHMAHADCANLGLFEEALHHGVRAAEEVAIALDPSRARSMERLG